MGASKSQYLRVGEIAQLLRQLPTQTVFTEPQLGDPAVAVGSNTGPLTQRLTVHPVVPVGGVVEGNHHGPVARIGVSDCRGRIYAGGDILVVVRIAKIGRRWLDTLRCIIALRAGG